ncbi:histone-lysine N-methyltransferase SETMAR [Trichonephila clavipes]|uniref:Histone-lysine N-methyltransferase SETMAR n=1 Tax=Trichonephila clavipes TaxID=2585209 RepID=A0A8X6SX18_TRICX|nr:histone-lysine N-methyltransferase SETMAR [Trichonephila clavipes]
MVVYDEHCLNPASWDSWYKVFMNTMPYLPDNTYPNVSRKITATFKKIRWDMFGKKKSFNFSVDGCSVEISREVLNKQFQIYARYQGLTTRKVLLKVGLERRNHLLFASVWPNTKLTCQQLNRLKLAIDQKWPELANRRGVVFLQNKARLHTSVVTFQKLWELSWEVLMYPPYSPDLATSDYLIFLALNNFLSDKKVGSREDCENLLLEFLANMNQDFYEKFIMKLPLKR